MKYFSEKTGKVYNTVAECESAELEAIKAENLEKARKEHEARIAREEAEKAKKQREELANARKAAAEKVDNAYKEMVAAQKAYKDELSKFCKEYGSYHTSISDKEIPLLFDLFTPALEKWFS